MEITKYVTNYHNSNIKLCSTEFIDSNYKLILIKVYNKNGMLASINSAFNSDIRGLCFYYFNNLSDLNQKYVREKIYNSL